MPKETHDYLAIIPVGCGSSHGRAPTKDLAIERAIRFFRDWDGLIKVADIDVNITVVDVAGYDEVYWGAIGGIRGKNNVTGEDEQIDRPCETVTRRTPKWRKRK